MSAFSPAAFSSISRADLGNRISVAVARKALDAAEAQGEAMVDMIRAAGDTGRSALKITARLPHPPISASPAPDETGRRLDVTA